MGISKTNLGVSVESILKFITGKIPSSHNVITGRDSNDAHPITAITGLQTEVDKVNSINIAQKTVNQKNAQCLAGVIDGQSFTPVANLALPFIPTINNGIDYDETAKTYKLKANITYNIEALVRLISYQGYMYYCLYDYTNSKVIGKAGVCEANVGINQAIIQSFCVITPKTDINVGVKVTSIGGTQTGAKLQNTSYMNIQEMERTIIDPVEYVNSDKGIEDTPVGHILSFIGTTPPAHYINCNGAIFNIVDYPHLSQHIKDQFGTFNYFGGDGITSFAVPDLRNEFLRGYYSDKTEKLSGEIGKHQDSTTMPYFGTRITTAGAGMIWYAKSRMATNNDTFPKNTDGLNYDTKTPLHEPIFNGSNVNATAGWGMASSVTSFTAKPTNVAVLYCIKYEPTYFMNIQGLIEETVLWQGNIGTDTITPVNNTLDLSYPIIDYDKIVAYYYTFATNRYLQSQEIYSADIKKMIDEPSLKYQISLVWGYGSNADFTSILNTSTYQKLSIIQSFSHITKIVGVKYKTSQSADVSYTNQEITNMVEGVYYGN